MSTPEPQAAPPPAEVRTDAWCVPLAQGELRETFGLIGAAKWERATRGAAWDGCVAAVEQLHQALRDADPEGCVYAMPFHTFHVTVATAVKFTSARGLALAQADSATQQTYIDSWTAFLRGVWDECDAAGAAAAPTTEFVVSRVEVHAGCIIFRIDDRAGAMDALRARLHTAAASSDEFAALSQDGDFFVPSKGFVHSTIARFVKEPTNPAAFMARMREVAKTWKPVTISMGVFDLWNEAAPFMHRPLPTAQYALRKR